MKNTLKQRIESNVTITTNGCWVWNKLKQRYGIMSVDGKTQRVHRVAWSEFKGKIPTGISVLHHCDNPPCCNPDHLFLGTQKDNMRDCARKGRAFLPTCPNHKKARGDRNGMRRYLGISAGQKNGNSKLTNAQRDEIVELRKQGALRQDLATRYGVNESQIFRICKSRGVLPKYPANWTPMQRAKIMQARGRQPTST